MKSEPDALNVGGFSDAVFDLIANFYEHGSSADAWIDEIERIDLNEERSR
jgi:60 kDa SS-A/Ro ribonucleoprotein